MKMYLNHRDNQSTDLMYLSTILPAATSAHELSTTIKMRTLEGDVELLWNCPAHEAMNDLSLYFGSLMYANSVSLEHGRHLLKTEVDPELLCKLLRIAGLKIETIWGCVTGHLRKCGWRYIRTAHSHTFEYRIAGQLKERVTL